MGFGAGLWAATDRISASARTEKPISPARAARARDVKVPHMGDFPVVVSSPDGRSQLVIRSNIIGKARQRMRARPRSRDAKRGRADGSGAGFFCLMQRSAYGPGRAVCRLLDCGAEPFRAPGRSP